MHSLGVAALSNTVDTKEKNKLKLAFCIHTYFTNGV